ncbi:MAG: hypothetical protein ACOH5I_23255 [Oligoflexus sp.]
MTKLMAFFFTAFIVSCGSQEQDRSDLNWWWNKSQAEELRFNFASHASNHAGLRSLSPYVVGGASHLELGRRDRFQVQTNATIHTESSSSSRQARSQYWADGYVFNQQIGGRGRGSLVDIQASSSLSPIQAQGLVRFLGQEKLKGNLDGKWDQTFTRNLALDSVYYPAPLLGVRFKGNIGGEIGYRSELSINETDALALSFLPKANLHAGISGGVEALQFARAEVVGAVQIIEASLASVTSLSYLPKLSLVLADIGVEGGDFKAMDGQIDIGASAGLSMPSVLPGGVDQALWQMVFRDRGQSFQWDWQHTLWNPEALVVQSIPRYGQTFKHFLVEPSSRSECESKAADYQQYVVNIGKNVDNRVRQLDSEYQSTGRKELLDQMKVEASMKTNYNLLLSEVLAHCHSL